ncbi:HD-3 [Ecytonucleospora hepatopenaei]|uniref:HD-3 n=1 Tax=Ecytonucleospora hepatopenaei TaxID=646526 RepID=A0A1W0E6L8_9MICR|nr:HD-3 [Ecytonucleospora hepatopenaei]
MKTNFCSFLVSTQHKSDRVKLSVSQTNVLVSFFKNNPKPTYEERERLGSQINLSADKIKNWFQNKRAKLKIDAKDDEFWNSKRQTKITQILKTKVYPGCNNFFQPRDFDV